MFKIYMNSIFINWIILIIGMIIYASFHIIGSYGYKFWEKQKKSFEFIFIVGVLLGTISYSIKVPLFYFFGKQNIIALYIIYLVILSIILVLFTKFFFKEEVPIHTYIILFLIILLLCIDQLLTIKNKKK